jgi:hypothetical protein
MAFAQSGDISGSTSNLTPLGTTILKLRVRLAGFAFVGLIIWGGLARTTNRPGGLAMIGGGMVGALLAPKAIRTRWRVRLGEKTVIGERVRHPWRDPKT